MRNFFFLLLLGLASCTAEINHHGKTPLASVDNVYLYKEDLMPLIPLNLTGEDSVRFVNDYIRKWAEDIMFYNKAKSNMSNEKEIDKFVENYRRSLIVNEYQERLVREKLDVMISDEEVRKYYDDDKSLFILDYPMLKGVYIKVAMGDRELPNVRRYMKFRNESDRDRLESFTIRGAADYSYFMEHWEELTDISQKLPSDANKDLFNENHHLYEFKDTAYVYMLYVDTMISKGDYIPFELAYKDIWEVIYNERKAAYIKEVREDLYRKAVRENDIKIYEGKTE